MMNSTLYWTNTFNDACLAEKQQIPILLPLVWPDRGSKLRVNKVQIYRPEQLFYSFSNFEWHSLELVVQLQHLARTIGYTLVLLVVQKEKSFRINYKSQQFPALAPSCLWEPNVHVLIYVSTGETQQMAVLISSFKESSSSKLKTPSFEHW